MISQKNIFDKLIVFYIGLLAFGGLGGSLTPIRLFTIICLPFIFFYSSKFKRSYKFEKYFFIFWIIYALLSIFWSIDQTEAFKSVIYLIVNFFSFFTLIWMCNKANYPKKSIINGWIFSFILTIPIALVEIFFDKHLSISYMESYLGNFEGVYIQRNLASVTFGNINGYSTFLSYVSPFILISIMDKKSLLKWILLGFLFLIVFINASRGAILCIGLNIVAFVLFSSKNKRNILIYLFVISILSILIFNIFNEYLEFAFSRFQYQGFDDFERITIIKQGFVAFIESYFFGVGTANFIPYMQSKNYLIATSPHNLFLEILVQYGLIIFIGFLFLLFRVYKIFRLSSSYIKRIMYLLGITLIFSSFIDSGYLLGSVIWIFLASIYVLVDYRYNNND